MTDRLAGKTALVTGAALGIGKAIALRFAQAGARVALVDIDDKALAQTCEEIATLGGEAWPILADATDPASVEQGVDLALSRLGNVQVLVNNVGGGKAGRIWELSVEDWDRIMALNLRSMFLFTRTLVPQMIAQKSGRIICLSSGARNGTVWNAYYRGACAYSTAKAGVTGFVRDLAIELADHAITVNAIAPGPIDTELAGPYLRAMETPDMPLSPCRMTPLGRLGTPREVADAALYLAGDDAAYVTGTVLDVTGGR
ncbi:SDR family NAD(P)-dependent oxidoreductase [Novosphingobium sp. 9]|uniref:SDR family NAD(P)-dependent oxidoreductase n=1 Tax=Novosphingobium sp. 9 TaxID=2025349 RepID=UPI0021B5FB3B|nr:SDR family NAD(P)-dependent oxidoreductase [Novosphingobium sp. 9]